MGPDRYSDLATVAQWCCGPDRFAERCGFDVGVKEQYKLVKDFCNSAAGSGSTFEKEWLAMAGRVDLPAPMIEYRRELRIAAERDVKIRRDITQVYEDRGYSAQDLQNMVHYVCNSEIEHADCAAAMERRASLTTTVAFESDGHPCLVSGPSDCADILAAMNSGVEDRKQFVHKPYRNQDEIMAALKEKYNTIPAEWFGVHDTDWRTHASDILEFRRRMRDNQNPILLAKKLVPRFMYKGSLVSDYIATVNGSKDALDYVIFNSYKNGGYWCFVHRKIGHGRLQDVCAEFCVQTEGSKPGWSRARVADGSLPAKMASEVAVALYNESMMSILNNETSWSRLQFSCDTVLNIPSMTTTAGLPSHYTSHSTQYPYPFEEIAVIKERLASLDLDLEEILERVKEYESECEGEYKNIPEAYSELLDIVCGIPEMCLLKTIHAMFENWAVTIFRGGKIPACGLFCVPTEVFVHDRGDSGNNGKTVLQTITSVLAGGYFLALDDTLLTHPPPPASSPNPALFAMKGKRLFGTPEVEGQLHIQSAWVKKLADPATVWSAREPHAATHMQFKLSAMFMVSTNAKLQFTAMDGGVQRRAIGCPFEFTFAENPRPDSNERQTSEFNLKDPAVIRAHIAGYYYFIECVYRVFYASGYHKHPGKLPTSIATATDSLRTEELASLVVEILENDFVSVEQNGITPGKLRAYFLRREDVRALHTGNAPLSYAIDSILQTVCRYFASRGVRRLLYKNSQFNLK